MKIFTIALLSLVATGLLFGSTFTVDTAHSSVSFKVKHLMISTVTGKFEKFSGKFEYDEKTKTLKSLTGDIDPSSINTSIPKRDEHLKSKDFFDVGKYPNITFVLTKVDSENIYGRLTMHGVSKDIVLKLENNEIGKDQTGKTKVGLSLSGIIERKDFGLTYNSILETGGIAIGDKVKVEIELEGALQK